MLEFFDEVYAIVAEIPYGRVASYGQIAQMAGRPRNVRMVGQAMRNCPEGLPWHRVIRSDGSIARGVLPDLCRDLPESEGIEFLENGCVDMARFLWEQWI